MYSTDRKNNRILTYTGKTAYSTYNAAKYYLEHGEFPDGSIIDSEDIRKFHQTHPGHELQKIDVEQETVEPFDTNTSEEEEISFLNRLEQMPRYEETEVCSERLLNEFEFFSNNGFIGVLIALESLIDTFKKRGIVWGSGRGSSCASYILYVMEVHDVDPIRFGIDFSEMSKEYD